MRAVLGNARHVSPDERSGWTTRARGGAGRGSGLSICLLTTWPPHTYTLTHTYLYILTHIYTPTHRNTVRYLCTHSHTQRHIHSHAYIHTPTCIYTQALRHTHPGIHTHTHSCFRRLGPSWVGKSPLGEWFGWELPRGG